MTVHLNLIFFIGKVDWLNCTPRKEKSAALPPKKNMDVYVPFLHSKPSVLVSSFYCPSLCKIWSSGPWIPQTAGIGVLKFWMQQHLYAIMLQKDFSSLETFLFLIECLLGDQGSLWTKLPAETWF